MMQPHGGDAGEVGPGGAREVPPAATGSRAAFAGRAHTAEWEVAVVGAGPAGATAALHLAARGHRVLLLDRREFPREKTCGDGLLPDAVRALRRAGVWHHLESRAFRGTAARFFSPSRVAVAIPGEFHTVEREVLDATLLAAARSRGAVFRHARVERLEVAEGGGIRLYLGCGGEGAEAVEARVAVVATGAEVSLLEPLGMVQRAEPSAVAVRRYLRSEVPLEELVFSFDRANLPGYGWIFPLGGGRYNIGCGIFGRTSGSGINVRQLFEQFVAEFPLARRMVGDGEFLSPLRGARLRCGLDGVAPLGSGPLLVIGETIGATYPFSGEGIGKAMETGELAAAVIQRALADGTAAYGDYVAGLERLRPWYRGYAVAEAWFSRHWLADLVARRARRSRFLREAVTGIVAESVHPRKVFSVRGVLCSLWR